MCAVWRVGVYYYSTFLGPLLHGTLTAHMLTHYLSPRRRRPSLRCSVCDASLATWYFEKDGILFCKADYADKFGEACQTCSKVG